MTEDLPFLHPAEDPDDESIMHAQARVQRTVKARRRRRRVLMAAPAIALVLIGAAAAYSLARDTQEDPESVYTGTVPEEGAESVAGWEKAEDWPLAPRTYTNTVWTGDEMIVFGGYLDTCPAGADCTRTGEPFADGAALDPDTGEWRIIAPAPIPIDAGSSAAVDGAVYVWVPQPEPDPRIDPAPPAAFLRYDPAEDRWSYLPLPELTTRWYTLVAAGDSLLASPGSDQGGSQPTWRYEPAGQTWSELPDDPLPRLFDRSMAYDEGYAYLFGKELVPNPGSEEPSVLLGARLDLASGRWEELPTSESIGGGMWAAGDRILVNPALGSADGGEVNNWGRSYPFGAMFDATGRQWTDLPAAPNGDVRSAGFIGSDSSLFFSSDGGVVLDVAQQQWIDMPAAPGGQAVTRTVGAAGRDAVAVSGSRWDPGASEPEGVTDVWIWRPRGA